MNNYKYFRFDFVAKAIVGSKRSIKRANMGNTPEYKELSKMLKEQPSFTVEEKEINRTNPKKTYHDLTFTRMEEYIKLQPKSEELLEEFNYVIKIADAKGAKYPLAKKWFLAKFPEYKENEVPRAPINKECAGELAA